MSLAEKTNIEPNFWDKCSEMPRTQRGIKADLDAGQAILRADTNYRVTLSVLGVIAGLALFGIGVGCFVTLEGSGCGLSLATALAFSTLSVLLPLSGTLLVACGLCGIIEDRFIYKKYNNQEGITSALHSKNPQAELDKLGVTPYGLHRYGYLSKSAAQVLQDSQLKRIKAHSACRPFDMCDEDKRTETVNNVIDQTIEMNRVEAILVDYLSILGPKSLAQLPESRS